MRFFLAEASSERLTYFYYPWQTCYMHHLLKSLGSIHPLTRFKAPLVIAISVYSQVLIYGWVKKAPLSSPIAHAGQFMLSQLLLAALEPTILWFRVQRANHSAIVTRLLSHVQFLCCYKQFRPYLNGIVVILEPENVCLDITIMILCGLQAEILADIGFCIMAALKIQDGRHEVKCESGTYQKLKAKVLESMWKKFGAFVRNVHIHLLSCLTTILSWCETSSGCRGGYQHLGEYTNTSPSVSSDVTLMDPVVGWSPLLTESFLD